VLVEREPSEGVFAAGASSYGLVGGGIVERWIRWLTLSGTVIGALVVLYGIVRFVGLGAAPPLLIAVAILIVGPGEDIMQRWARETAPTPAVGALRATVVDRATSLAFLILLGVVIRLM